MGYDMYWVHPDPADEAAYMSASKEFYEAVNARDRAPEGIAKERASQAVSDLYHAMNKAQRHYFRLNIWGMGMYRRAMEVAGMLSDGESPEWPEPETFGLSRNGVWELLEDVENGAADLDAETLDKLHKFDAAYQAVLSDHGGETPGIPVWKLCDNSGWIVTPPECVAAVRLYHEYLDREGHEPPLRDHDGTSHDKDPEEVAYWHEWINWIGEAADYGGFRVL